MPSYILIILNILVIGLLSFVLFKIWRIHLTVLNLMTIAGRTNRETHNLYGQMQAFLELKSLLGLPMPLPSLRGWAASPDILLEIARHILASRPKVALECSSGSSTLVIARCMQINGEGRVFSLEHDPQYAQATRDELVRQGLEGWATVIDAPLEKLENQPGHRWYSLHNLPEKVRGVELLVIDGPPQKTCPVARYPAVPRLKSLLAPHAVIFLDDADRDGEKEAVKRWREENPGWSFIQLYCEKGCTKIHTAG